MVLVMLFRVVGMDGMGHISRHKERVSDRNLQHFVRCVKAAQHPTDRLRHDGAASAHC